MLRKVLIANRGEIALRIMRTCREMSIKTVAVYSEWDRNALHVRAADEAFLLGPAPPQKSYLCIDRLLEISQRAGVDAVHPGYGFLSENAGFARAVLDLGLIWIGPPPDAIRAMGDKVEARRTMKASGVPVVPGLTEEASDPGRLREMARALGYPVMIKAAGGGGGKGIRIVDQESELEPLWQRARSEARTGFGNAAVYLEKYLAEVRHIEIQVFADSHGSIVHLGERDCSLQRRHQKVIEESPSVVMTEQLREKMGRAATLAARSVGYVNAGTIEFLVDSDRAFYFLEMNTRLQVEHPVTEMVTGLDLVREQISVASGLPLSFRQQDVEWRGHAIEARVCSEVPESGFLPATGIVLGVDPPGGAHVRFDSSLYAGLEVGVHYDSMLAKLVVHAPDRSSAIERMRRALEELKITGVATNVAFLRCLIESDLFRSGRFHTKSVEQRLPELLSVPDEKLQNKLAVVAAVIHQQMERGRAQEGAERIADTIGQSAWAELGRSAGLSRWPW